MRSWGKKQKVYGLARGETCNKKVFVFFRKQLHTISSIIFAIKQHLKVTILARCTSKPHHQVIEIIFHRTYCLVMVCCNCLLLTQLMFRKTLRLINGSVQTERQGCPFQIFRVLRVKWMATNIKTFLVYVLTFLTLVCAIFFMKQTHSFRYDGLVSSWSLKASIIWVIVMFAPICIDGFIWNTLNLALI